MLVSIAPLRWFVNGVGKLLMGMLIVYTVVLAEVLLLYTRAGPRRGSVSANPDQTSSAGESTNEFFVEKARRQ